jgi:hypothetical protein
MRMQAGPDSREWLLGNPWWWMALALASCGLAWAWVLAARGWMPGVGYGLVVVGLLAAAGALVIRLGSNQPPYLDQLDQAQRNFLLLVLAGLFGLMVLGVSGLLLLSFLGLFSVTSGWGQLAVWWVVVAPMSATAAAQCWNRMREKEPWQVREEGALLCLLAALACFFSVWALYDPQDPLHLDTMRLFLGTLTLVALVAAPLWLIPQQARRGVISLLIVLHFGGILTACFFVPPSPAPVGQLYYRIYRPYLEFIYLTNAYHFYAPEPGPQCYLWFRVLFEDKSGQVMGEWHKIPDLDDQYRHRYASGLTYQRYLVITESTVMTESPPPLFVMHPDGSFGPAPHYFRRVTHSLQGVPKPVILGVPTPKVEMAIPFHPDINHINQYYPPTAQVKKLVASYARHVTYTAKMEGYKVKAVKIYRVIHNLPATPAQITAYLSGVVEPDDPDTYRPIYLGDYDTEGDLIDPENPFLYWVLPTIKENPMIRGSRYFSYARKHAGDPYWIFNDKKQWVDK